MYGLYIKYKSTLTPDPLILKPLEGWGQETGVPSLTADEPF